ncbi:hypothetical protein [Vibrio cholerae]|uniref:hypothetical protein n=1 Tax=Vibrio cholerae TaxID=666 RepID=UPI001E564C4B|nr:hypothetical protein [Vibrio cholerae]
MSHAETSLQNNELETVQQSPRQGIEIVETLGFKKPKLGLFNRGKFYEWFLYASESIVFRKNTVYERKELRDRAFGAINYGHSSLAFKEDGGSIATNSKLSMERRKSLSTTISGNIIFS